MQFSSDSVALSPADLDLLLFCAVRYAIGRRSYAVASVCEAVRRYGGGLPDVRRAALASDIERELEMVSGDLYHADEWTALAGWLRGEGS